MKFSLEPYSDALIEEMLPLWQAHYDEVAHFKDIPLDPNLAVYAGIAANGNLRIFTARQWSESGINLVGYQVFFLNANPHYKTSFQAVQDILFLDESVRKGMTGYRFIKWCDAQLKAGGVQVAIQHVKAKHDFGRILERLGYGLQDLIYTRRLA